MTFADLRALHAVIGAAIEDIERVYRPPQSFHRPSSSSNPHSLGLSTASTSSFHSARSSSHTRSSLYTDSDIEEDDCDEDDTPLTPISASNAQIHPSNPPPAPPNSVRFASTNKRTFGRVRERAHTISSLPQPNVSSPGTPPPMPPPILKQPPLDFPSLDAPLFVPITPPSSRLSTDSDPSLNGPLSHAQVTEDIPPSTNTASPQIAISPTLTVELENVGPASTLVDPTLRQREWRKKCEDLTSHPDVIKAVNKIVAACGQLSASVQRPFLSICDAAMGYHLPSCMRFLEAAHIVEMLREAGPDGLHVSEIAKKVDIGLRVSRGEALAGLHDSPASKAQNLVDPSHLSHILRLLATHHITREVKPDVFANNRISSVVDSGKGWQELIEVSTKPESKYEGSDGIAAFVGLCTDELFKASAHLTDCYLYPSSPPSPRQSPPSRSARHDSMQTSIPPVPPLPTTYPSRTQSLSSSSAPNSHRLGMYTPNDSKTSLASLVEHEQEGEAGSSAGAMTFASNPYPVADSGTPSKSRSRGRSVSHGPVTPPTPTSNTPSHRPGILKRLSSRSNLSVPLLPPPPMPATPKSPVTREAPETPRSRATSMSLVRQGQETPKSPAISTYATFRGLLNTPRATPNRSREETSSIVTDREEALRTPRSTPSRDSFTSSIHSEADIKHATPRWTPSRESLRSLAKKGSFASLRPRRPDPVSTPEPHDDGPQGYGALLSPESSQGSLGPAFDLRPPALTSPRSRTFPGSLPSPISTHAHAVDGLPPPVPHKYTVPPPLPLKSALRTASSSGLPSPVEPFDTKTSPTLCGPIQGAKKPRSKENQLANEMHAPFNVAFNTKMRYFEWLEKKENEFRLKRFGKAMTGTEKWEVPGSIIGGFPWHELPNRSIVVDVGGGIGSASMLLANAFPHLRFVIQDRVPVVEMGRSAWRARCPELLDSGRAAFQAHDFFKPQPDLPPEIDIGLALESESEAEPEDNSEQKLGTKVSGDAHTSDTPITPAVFLMRVITHDWPDSYVIRILLRLRRAAGPNTKLLLADYVLPLACADEDEDAEVGSANEDEVLRKMTTRQPLPGTLRSLAPEGTPLLANLGKANANAYWLDLTMRVMFNAQERTLRELTALTQRAGWKIVQVTRAEGSVFGHLVAIPVEIPPETLALAEVEEANRVPDSPDQGVLASSISSPQMGETFLSQMDLPSEAVIREGVATGSSKLNASKGKKRGRRERSYTFGSQRDTKDGKDSKGGEVRRGFRTLMKMLSKAQVKGDPACAGEGADAGGSKQRSRA